MWCYWGRGRRNKGYHLITVWFVRPNQLVTWHIGNLHITKVRLTRLPINLDLTNNRTCRPIVRFKPRHFSMSILGLVCYRSIRHAFTCHPINAKVRCHRDNNLFNRYHLTIRRFNRRMADDCLRLTRAINCIVLQVNLKDLWITCCISNRIIMGTSNKAVWYQHITHRFVTLNGCWTVVNNLTVRHALHIINTQSCTSRIINYHNLSLRSICGKCYLVSLRRIINSRQTIWCGIRCFRCNACRWSAID